MSATEHFATDYAQARDMFLAAAKDAGVPVTHFRNPETGPPGGHTGGTLFTDVARVGSPDAENVVIAVSGTHGVEGFFGSGCQVGWLRDGHWRGLPADTAVVLVHAINPYGFAWLRRVNEDNIDINRNFVDFAHIPDNPAYGELADILLPDSWDDASQAEMDRRIDAFIAEHGMKAYRAAVVGGQRTHPDGLFYGGRAPCWSNDTITEITRTYLSNAKRLAVLDFHTGLGPYAYAELICRHPPGSADLARARAWYGEAVTSPQSGESDSPPIEGNLRMAFGGLLPGTEVTSIAVEMGTRDMDQVLRSLIADNWLHAKGEVDSPTGRAIKSAIRDSFFPDEPEWKERAFTRSMEIMAQAVQGVSSE
jgi:hypothetical protein